VRAALGAAARRAAEECHRAVLLLVLAFLPALGLAGCGKKGDPQAPVPRGPRAASDLAAEQEGLSAVLSFSYPDRLLTGERPEPAFLITKPYQPDTVKAIVSQALFFERRAHLRDRPQMSA
jgi:hypothetical protein